MWFKQLTGFNEESPEQVRRNLKIVDDTFVSSANNKQFGFGKLQVATLSELKAQSLPREIFKDKIKVSEIIADVQSLHEDVENSNALFQAASQFNLLEMVGPHIMPENGIDRYQEDYTQGPACAIACGAGTIYRNYFVNVNGQIGQTKNNQINCLDKVAKILDNETAKYWRMQNGYAMFDQEGLLSLNKKLASLSTTEREELKNNLKTGIQWNTEVTSSITRHKVSQIYCSALPVAYCRPESIYWESFARIILEATYESTLYAALINMDMNESNKVYLTLVGGNAFGNEENWILESMQQALKKFKNIPLDVYVVSYKKSNQNLLDCIGQI